MSIEENEYRQVYTSDKLSDMKTPEEKEVLAKMKLIEKTFRELEKLAPKTQNVEFYFNLGQISFEYQPYEEYWYPSTN